MAREVWSNNNETRVIVVTCDDTLADCDPVNLAGCTGGSFLLPSGKTSVTAALWVSPTEDGTYLAADDNAGTAIVQTIVNGVPHAFEDAILRNWTWAKFVLNAAESAECTLIITTS